MICYIKKYFLLLFLWLLPVIAFVFFYKEYDTTRNTSLVHACLMSLVANSIILFVVFLNAFLKESGKALFVISSSIWFFVVSLIYLLMVIGLLCWGRIPTGNILLVYASQYEELLSALGVNAWLLLLALFLFFLIVCIFLWISVRCFSSLSHLYKGGRFSKSMCFLLFCVSSALIVKLWFYEIIWSSDSREPLLQFFVKSSSDSGKNVLLETLGKHADTRMAIQEEKVRKLYKVDKKKNVRSVILITVDALRPDRMGIYGAERQTTPNLQRMKNEGNAYVVEEARAACPESTCGLLSLLSGKEPQQLLPDNFGLPEILGKIGYKRYFILSGDHSNYYGLRESYGGSDMYWDSTFKSDGYLNDDFTLLGKVRELPAANINENYFLFIHLMSVHGLGRKYVQFEKWKPKKSIYNPTSSLNSDLDLYRNQYDNGILQADFIVNEIYNLLINKGYIDNSSIVLVTADHGEALGEHGVRSHAESLYEPVIRIPWIWLGPHPLGDIKQPVIQADFAPTVLTEIGSPIPEHWRGKALQNGTHNREFTFHAQLPLAAVVKYSPTERKKLIMDFKKNNQLFFDLKSDEKERAPLPYADKGYENKLKEAGFSFLGKVS